MTSANPSRIRRRVATFTVAGGLLLAPFGLTTSPVTASQCDPELQTACAVVGTVVCKVAAKDKPCLK